MGYQNSKYLGYEAKKILDSFSNKNDEYKKILCKKTASFSRNEILSYVAYDFNFEEDNIEDFKKTLNILSIALPKKPKNYHLILDIITNNPQFMDSVSDLISFENMNKIENIYKINHAHRKGKINKAAYNKLIAPIINKNIESHELLRTIKEELSDFGFGCKTNKMMLYGYTTHPKISDDKTDSITTFITDEKGVSTPISILKKELKDFVDFIETGYNDVYNDGYKSIYLLNIIEEYIKYNDEDYIDSEIIDVMSAESIEGVLYELYDIYDDEENKKYKRPIFKIIETIAKNSEFQENLSYLAVPPKIPENILREFIPLIKEDKISPPCKYTVPLLLQAETHKNLTSELNFLLNKNLRESSFKTTMDNIFNNKNIMNLLDFSKEETQQLIYTTINDSESHINKNEKERATSACICGSYFINTIYRQRNENRQYEKNMIMILDMIQDSQASNDSNNYSIFLANLKSKNIQNKFPEEIEEKIDNMIKQNYTNIDKAIFSSTLINSANPNSQNSIVKPKPKILNNTLLEVEKIISNTTLKAREIEKIEESLESWKTNDLEFDKEIYIRILNKMKYNENSNGFLKNINLER